MAELSTTMGRVMFILKSGRNVYKHKSALKLSELSNVTNSTKILISFGWCSHFYLAGAVVRCRSAADPPVLWWML